MKRSKLFVVCCLFLSLTFSSFAQLVDAPWKTIPSAALTAESVDYNVSKLDYMPSNRGWYFTYVDYSSNTLFVKKFSAINQSWSLVFSEVLGGNILDLDTYIANGKMYLGVVNDQTTMNFSLWQMESNDAVTNIFLDINSSIPFGGKMNFVAVNDELFLSTMDLSGEYYIDRYNLTGATYITTDTLGLSNASIEPDLVVDHSDNSLVISLIDFSNFYRVYKSPIQASLNFVPMNSTGEITSPSSFYTGNAYGQWVKLVEKGNNSPEVVFTMDAFGVPHLFRMGLYNNSAAEMQFTNPDILSTPAVAQHGTNTFIGGTNPIVSNTEVWEVTPNGSKTAVASNFNPTVLTGQSDGLLLSYGKALNDARITAFYHMPSGNGSMPGYMKMTNYPPLLASSTISSGCAGSFSNLIEDIAFEDNDGDEVEIVQNTLNSSVGTVVGPSTLFAFQDAFGNWIVEGQGQSAGQTTISFSYTDGFDTLFYSTNVVVNDPAQVSFTSQNIELCSAEDMVDMNEYVDSTGGTFYVGDFISEDGYVPFDSLDILSLPHNESVIYDYVDVNGCNISVNSPMTIYDNPSSVLSVVDSDCGSSNGEISATISSPNGAFSNYWNTGDQDVNSVSGLSPGTYYHNIIDVKGCIGVSQASVQASDVTVVADTAHPSCFGGNDGSLQLSINGANGPYDVLWSSGQSTSNIQNLSAGNYVATISNDNGCSVSVSYNLVSPPPIQMEYSRVRPGCGQSNGAVQQIMIQGGVGNYSYLWTSGGTGQDMVGVPAGNYGLQVTDGNGCSVTKAYQLNSLQSAGVNADISRTLCGNNSGSIELDVYPVLGETVTNILWSNGANTEDIYNLSPGTYTCEIQQSNGCVADFSWEVKSFRPPRPEICIVTVDTATTTNLVVWEKPVANFFDIHHYNIYRETSNAGEFQLIDTVNYSSISVFNDVVASPVTRSWRYRISAVSSCGRESIPSKAHKTIHLVTNDLGNGEYKVVWDNYEGFQYSTYDLLRYTDQDAQWVVIDAGIPLTALPNTIDAPPSIAGLDYMIEVNPPGGTCVATENKAQDYNSSRSNKQKSEFNPGSGTGDPNNSLIKHENDQFTIAMYPNPSDGQFEVALYHEEADAIMNINVVSIQGQLVYSSSIQNGVNYIDLGVVESGVYFVNIQDGNNTERLKIVVK